ncbi:ankyrin repeat-containing domain protein [Nemania abortiva]|nr:ankyrin repeat-containing domain protein [Nemania abortiva]
MPLRESRYYEDAWTYCEPGELLQLLLSSGADVNQRGGYYGTALQAACYRGDIDRVHLLLDHGAEVNAEAGEYGTALQAACFSGQLDIARLLIKHRADVHLQGGRFGSAWHAAVVGGRRYNGKYQGYGDYDIYDNHYRDRYHKKYQREHDAKYGKGYEKACDRNYNNDLLQLLLDNHVDVNDTQGLKDPTALHAAVRLDTSMASFLFSRGANVNISLGTYGSPLQWACACEDNNERVSFLLKERPNIDVNARGGIFGSALQAAAHSGQTSSVELLLEKGAHVNAPGGKYQSALNAAIFKGFWHIVDMLLEHGAKSDHQQQPELDEEWLTHVEEEDGEEAVARYRVFWEKQPLSSGAR